MDKEQALNILHRLLDQGEPTIDGEEALEAYLTQQGIDWVDTPPEELILDLRGV